MQNLSELVLFAETQTGGHHTLNLIANCFGGRLSLTDEAKAVMRKRMSFTSPRTIKENEALKACGLPRKTDGVGAEATFPCNFYNQPKEVEDGPRKFSEFDPQTW